MTELLNEDIYQVLERLNSERQQKLQVESSGAKQRAEIEQLKDKVRLLKKKRQELQETAENHPVQFLRQILNDQAALDSEPLPSNLEEVVNAAHIQKLNDINNCYRLTGISIISEDNYNTLCFDTTENGEFLGAYHVVLHQADDLIKVVRHNLPEYVPLKKFIEEDLNIDIKAFTKKISKSLKEVLKKEIKEIEIEEV